MPGDGNSDCKSPGDDHVWTIQGAAKRGYNWNKESKYRAADESRKASSGPIAKGLGGQVLQVRTSVLIQSDMESYWKVFCLLCGE